MSVYELALCCMLLSIRSRHGLCPINDKLKLDNCRDCFVGQGECLTIDDFLLLEKLSDCHIEFMSNLVGENTGSN